MDHLHPSYLLFVGIAVALAIFFPVAKHLRDRRDRRSYYVLQVITLLGAIVGAKLSVLLGDYHWPWTPVSDWGAALVSGRSITGALIGGFLAAEIAKPILHYTLPPNDRFAALLPFTIAIGRVGCLLAGCCRGMPYGGWCAIAGTDGVPRHPTQVYEMIFQVAIGVFFVGLVRRGILFGRLFSLYLIVYGVFRFLTEFVRDTPKTFGSLSGYQLLCVVMVLLGAAFFLKRTVAPPAAWRELQSANSSQEVTRV